MHALFAFGGVDFIDATQDFFGIAFLQDDFVGDDLFGNFDFVFRKKLLRFGRTRSAVAVIMPADLGHGNSPS